LKTVPICEIAITTGGTGVDKTMVPLPDVNLAAPLSRSTTHTDRASASAGEIAGLARYLPSDHATQV
jgi:hypothetical protein